VCVDFENLGAW